MMIKSIFLLGANLTITVLVGDFEVGEDTRAHRFFPVLKASKVWRTVVCVSESLPS